MKRVSQAVIYGKLFDFPCTKSFLEAYQPKAWTYAITINQRYPYTLTPILTLLRSLELFDVIDKIRYEDLPDRDYCAILVDVISYSEFEQIMRVIASERPFIHVYHPYATFDIVKGKAGSYDEA